MKPPMNHTAYKVAYTRNAYGDFVAGSQMAIPCHFRYIASSVTSTISESIQSDAMAWFEPDSGIKEQDIVIIEDEGFRVERVTKARRLRNTTVLFLKCDLLKYGIIS